MKKLILTLALTAACSYLFAQQKEEAETLVGEGIILHDKGDYKGAIAKYDEALKLDTPHHS